MALKRKASFTTIVSPRQSSSYHAAVSPVPFCQGDVMTIDETPRHLHSRTRKRFKNDRPDDQTIYDKTVRWLFSAQKQLKNNDSSMVGAPTQPIADEPPQTTSTSLEPMQQTLRRFFQPIRHATSNHTILPGAAGNNPQQGGLAAWDSPSPMSYGGSGSSNDVDMHMPMDIDPPSDYPSLIDTRKKWVGGIGWM